MSVRGAARPPRPGVDRGVRDSRRDHGHGMSAVSTPRRRLRRLASRPVAVVAAAVIGPPERCSAASAGQATTSPGPLTTSGATTGSTTASDAGSRQRAGAVRG
jgi:hypothetical protein